MRTPGKDNYDHKLGEIVIILGIFSLLIMTIINLDQTSSSIKDITGNAVSRVNITPAPPVFCNLTLEPGWNLVSFMCIIYEVDRINVIENITQLRSIFEYQEGSSDPWKSYNPSLPSWVVHDLEKMKRVEGYWIDAESSEQVVIQGGLRVPTNVPLEQGWNLVGYPTNKTKTVNESFASIAGNFTEVRAFNRTTKGYYNYIPPATGPLNQTVPGEGYWINVTQNEVWIVD
ncbi:hypothetical protein JW826_05290 [Candidatus Woesearchaeota archaeon]|nr:hypothetical protein [Candidatus Woesearchaeota archaeon]